jgi:6-phosphogluconolactonase (cycloisomerase 2 family)
MYPVSRRMGPLALVLAWSISLAGAQGAVAADLTDVDALDRAWELAVSPDGAHVYVVARFEDALAVFTRDPVSGELTPLESHHNGVGGVSGMDEPRDIAVSPDGAHVYVACYESDSVVLFSRDALTGALTFADAWSHASTGRTEALKVSPDGANVYVAADEFLTVFQRNAVTGALTWLEADHHSGDIVHDVAISPDGASVYAGQLLSGDVRVYARNPGTGALTRIQTVDSFRELDAVVVAPDGAHVYLGGSLRRSIILPDRLGMFSRNPVTGTLTHVSTLSDVGGIDSIAISADGAYLYTNANMSVYSRDPVSGLVTLEEAAGPFGIGLAFSPDEAHLYAARSPDGVLVFERDATTGLLTLVQTVDGTASLEEGKRLRITNKVPENPERNRVSVKGTFRISREPVCGDDPPGTVKATIQLYSDSSGQDTGAIPLPCENWEETSTGKLRYRDRELDEGPCRVVNLKEDRFKAVCFGKGPTTELPYDLVPQTDEGRVYVVFRSDGAKRCMRFDGIPGRNGTDGKRFFAGPSTRPQICPPSSVFP